MANATLYSHLDAAGPGLRTVAGSGAYPAITRLYDLLYPCLVSGYGAGAAAKPGQGWVLIHADLPNGFTLQAPDGVFYVFYKGPNVVAPGASSGPNGVQVYMAEAVASPYTYPPTGTNVRSGDYSSGNPGDANRHWVCFSTSSNAEDKWFLIARGSQVLFFRDNWGWDTVGGDDASTAAVNRSGMYFLGNVRLKDESAPRTGPQCSMVQGGYLAANTTATASSATQYSNSLGGLEPIPIGSDTPTSTPAMASRLRDFLSGVVEAGALVRTTANPTKHSRLSMARQSITTLPADIRLEPVDVWLAGVGTIGLMPGIFHGGRSCHYKTADLLVAFGKGSGISETLVPVVIDGEPYHILPTGYGSIFVSLLEKYWQ